MMLEPCIGIIDSELDYNGCWYHFLYPHGKTKEAVDFKCLSTQGLGCGTTYAVYDWIERI